MSDEHGRIAPKSAAGNSDSELTEADNQFFLGLYRCAVNEYQPKIEKRTGVSLGPITVRDYREADQDFMQYLERIRQSWTTRLFFRSRRRTRLQQWRDYLEATHKERWGACMASYQRNHLRLILAWNQNSRIRNSVCRRPRIIPCTLGTVGRTTTVPTLEGGPGGPR
jgi:hypothetical protein